MPVQPPAAVRRWPCSPGWMLVLLFVVCFTAATRLHLWFQGWAGGRTQNTSLLEILMGDSRQLFASYFFTQADVYFHAGYYPTIFDNVAPPKQLHMAENPSAPEEKPEEHHPAPEARDKARNHEHDDLPDFLQEPANWIDRFGRYFYPSEHLHMEKRGEEREILPWLRMSASLDPHRVQTYTVASYWLRTRLGKVKEAEQFLREGLRENPDSYEILYELGRLYDEDQRNNFLARNLYEMAWRKWQAQQAGQPEPDLLTCAGILTHLARLEDREQRTAQAIAYLRLLQKISPTPQLIQQQIDQLQSRQTNR